MKCKYCKNIVPQGSVFCNICGARLAKLPKKELSVPKPRQRADGRWVGQLMVDGKRVYVTGKTVEEYELQARATKAGLIASRDEPPKLTLGEAIDRYIASNENILSPSTLRGYEIVRKYRFTGYMNREIASIQWQSMINEEAGKASAKTVKNAWGLVSASLNAAGENVPAVNLPKVPRQETPFLDYEQIQTFLAAMKDQPGELAALLGLHSLRQSEIFGLRAKDIRDGYIYVDKAIVPDAQNIFVEKKTTKTAKSTRAIPVMIPRLLEILPEPSDNRLVTERPSTVYNRIKRVCIKAGLPEMGAHGLRRSFASLCYHLRIDERTVMQLGGWSNMQTVHNFYIKLAQTDENEGVKKLRNYFGFTTDEP